MGQVTPNYVSTIVRPPWFHQGLPAREDCILRDMLDTRAARYPDRQVALFEDGTRWTYRECLAMTRSMAAGLQKLGVRKGDRVAAWLPNGPRLILTWFASNYLGAVFVPLNTAFRGGILEHVINQSRARILLAHAELIERLQRLSLPTLERVIAIGKPGTLPDDIRVDDEALLSDDQSSLNDSERAQLWDPQTIIFTSGTTGPSKGVLSPYLQLYTTALVNYGYINEGAAVLVNLPLFHVGGTSSLYCALIKSGCFYLVGGFNTATFWQQVRHGNCATTSGLIGIMASFLARQPPRSDDGDNPLRGMTMFPINDATIHFAKRFHFDYVTGFNMTEVSTPLITDLNTQVQGSCGTPRSGVTCRLVDEHDIEVPLGAIGELIVRTDLPWSMNMGYDGMPQATADAWRNGWFHTGDAFRQDPAGNYFFVDRIKDTIRRRGENISSVEVEAEVKAHPAVDEAVAVAVAADGGEDEVLVAIVLKQLHGLEPAALIEFLRPRMPYFMVPRYLRFVAEIPSTETNKLRKNVFREAGVTADTWDREAAGIRLKREKLRS